jgi:hypothetical protein
MRFTTMQDKTQNDPSNEQEQEQTPTEQEEQPRPPKPKKDANGFTGIAAFRILKNKLKDIIQGDE